MGMTTAEKAALNGHVTGEIQTPYYDPRDTYDDLRAARSLLYWGLGGFIVGLLIIIAVVLDCR
jgi:hypothetical protein